MMKISKQYRRVCMVINLRALVIPVGIVFLNKFYIKYIANMEWITNVVDRVLTRINKTFHKTTCASECCHNRCECKSEGESSGEDVAVSTQHQEA